MVAEERREGKKIELEVEVVCYALFHQKISCNFMGLNWVVVLLAF
jgi:hypothetical protein